MYLDFTVDIPDELGKISCFRKGGNIYVRYVVERTYHPDEEQLFTDRGVLSHTEGHRKLPSSNDAH